MFFYPPRTKNSEDRIPVGKHVSDLTFGRIDIESSILYKIMRETPKMADLFEAKFLLMEAYDQSFGIHDYIEQSFMEQHANSTKRPLSLIAAHPGEDVSNVSILYEKIELFSDLRIGDYFKISIDKFLDLPKDISDKLILEAEKRFNKERTSESNIERELNQLSNLQTKK